MSAFWLLLLIASGALWVIRDLIRRGKTTARREVTYPYPLGLRPYPLLGHLPQFLANRHRLLDWMTEALASSEPTCTFVLRRPGGVRGVITANVEHLLRHGFDLDELLEMHYAHAAITESMRVYPPVPGNALRAEADDVLPDGTAVRAGWFAAYNAYAMARMESVWGEDAREYRPERWLLDRDPDGVAFRPESPFRFVAFHAGPRACLGKEMAYIQMKSIVACVLEEFDVEVDGAYRPRQVASLTLRMRDGLPVTVKPRRDCRLTRG